MAEESPVPRGSDAQVMITGDAAGTAISIGKAAMIAWGWLVQANLQGETRWNMGDLHWFIHNNCW